MATPDGSRPSLDLWLSQVEDLATEVANLHTANVHDWCDSLPRRRSEHLVRRLRLALVHVGLDPAVALEWVSAESEGICFGRLDHTQSEKLVRALESVASHRGRI